MSNIFLAATATLIWGSTWLIIRYQLGVVSPHASVAYRFCIASLILFAWCLIRNRGKNLKFSKQDHAFMILQGISMFGLNYHMAYLAAGRLTSGINAVVFSTSMVFSLINAAIFLGIRITIPVVMGSICGLTGISLIYLSDFQNFEFSSGSLLGVAYSMAGALSGSFGNVISARHQRHQLPVTETNAFAMGYGSLFTLLVLVFAGVPLRFDGHLPYVSSLLYLSVFGSIFAFGSFLKLIGNIGPERASYALLLAPVVALLLSTFFENFTWTSRSLVGLTLLLSGNLMINNKKSLSQWVRFRIPGPFAWKTLVARYFTNLK